MKKYIDKIKNKFNRDKFKQQTIQDNFANLHKRLNDHELKFVNQDDLLDFKMHTHNKLCLLEQDKISTDKYKNYQSRMTKKYSVIEENIQGLQFEVEHINNAIKELYKFENKLEKTFKQYCEQFKRDSDISIAGMQKRIVRFVEIEKNMMGYHEAVKHFKNIVEEMFIKLENKVTEK